MPKIPGVSQRAAIAALQKAGFQIIRQSGHVIMSNGVRTLTIPRNSPINAYTMGNIAKQAGFTPDEFRKLTSRCLGRCNALTIHLSRRSRTAKAERITFAISVLHLLTNHESPITSHVPPRVPPPSLARRLVTSEPWRRWKPMKAAVLFIGHWMLDVERWAFSSHFSLNHESPFTDLSRRSPATAGRRGITFPMYPPSSPLQRFNDVTL